jgi:hypothetical protein
MGVGLQPIKDLYEGERFRDEQGNVGVVLFEDPEARAILAEWRDGSRHQYHAYTGVTKLSPEPRPAVLGGC